MIKLPKKKEYITIKPRVVNSYNFGNLIHHLVIVIPMLTLENMDKSELSKIEETQETYDSSKITYPKGKKYTL